MQLLFSFKNNSFPELTNIIYKGKHHLGIIVGDFVHILSLQGKVVPKNDSSLNITQFQRPFEIIRGNEGQLIFQTAASGDKIHIEQVDVNFMEKLDTVLCYSIPPIIQVSHAALTKQIVVFLRQKDLNCDERVESSDSLFTKYTRNILNGFIMVGSYGIIINSNSDVIYISFRDIFEERFVNNVLSGDEYRKKILIILR